MTARLAACCLTTVLALAAAVAWVPSMAWGSADERILGTTAPETLRGGAGDDRISAHRGADRVFGGSGDDEVDGGPGPDRIAAGTGDDLVLARDGSRDRVFCGPGTDRAIVDRADVVTAGCERIVRPPHAGAAMPMGAVAAVPMPAARAAALPAAPGPSATAGWLRGTDLVVCVAVAAAPGQPVGIRVDAPGGAVEGQATSGPDGMLLAGVTVDGGGAAAGPVAIEVRAGGRLLQASASLDGPRGGVDCTPLAEAGEEGDPAPAGEDPPAG